MIDSGLEYLRGESTLNLDDPAWDLTPGGSFLNSNTAGITGELGLLEPLFFDPRKQHANLATYHNIAISSTLLLPGFGMFDWI